VLEVKDISLRSPMLGIRS